MLMPSSRYAERTEMTKIMGYLIMRDDRMLFLRDLEDAQWAIADQEYDVIRLVDEVELARIKEDLELYTSICELQDEELSDLKRQLKELQEK